MSGSFGVQRSIATALQVLFWCLFPSFLSNEVKIAIVQCEFIKSLSESFIMTLSLDVLLKFDLVINLRVNVPIEDCEVDYLGGLLVLCWAEWCNRVWLVCCSSKDMGMFGNSQSSLFWFTGRQKYFAPASYLVLQTDSRPASDSSDHALVFHAL